VIREGWERGTVEIELKGEMGRFTLPKGIGREVLCKQHKFSGELEDEGSIFGG